MAFSSRAAGYERDQRPLKFKWKHRLASYRYGAIPTVKCQVLPFIFPAENGDIH